MINAADYFHWLGIQHSTLSRSSAASNSLTESCCFAFGNGYSSRNQRTSQNLNAHGHYFIAFDSLTSNFIHFLIAYINTSV